MILWLSLQWWYSDGFKWVLNNAIIKRLLAWESYFSVNSLIKTLFAPYKQTFVGGGGSGIGMAFRAWVDRTISRFVGLLIRSVLILSWIVCSLTVIISGLFIIILWPFIPIFPMFSIMFLLFRGLS